ncbi:MAG: GDP-mannose 4,6-dehydratase [Thermoleophilaceae bacterium]
MWLVTGGSGFVGSHLLDHLDALGQASVSPSRAELDLLDAEGVRAAIRELRPTVVCHLAARASVKHSWERPTETLVQNVTMAANLLEALRLEAREATLVLAGSGEVYGPPETQPVDEEAPLRPQNPYAVSKAACDLLGGQYADSQGLRVVRTRAFNHAGPGQSEDYVLGTLTRQVAEAEAGGKEDALLRTGSLDAARDFTDVRDVVRAYAVAAELPAGAYNVCSGRAVRIGELVELVRGCARIPVRQELDPARLRPHEVLEVRGSAERLERASGWRPAIPLERTVGDALDHWRARLAAGG